MSGASVVMPHEDPFDYCLDFTSKSTHNDDAQLLEEKAVRRFRCPFFFGELAIGLNAYK